MIRGKLVAFQNIERCEASRVACLLLLFLMAAMCCLPEAHCWDSCRPWWVLKSQSLTTLAWVWHPRDLPSMPSL